MDIYRLPIGSHLPRLVFLGSFFPQCLNVSEVSVAFVAESKSLNDNVTLESAGIKSGQQIILKDLGPQIGWKTVFLVEYAGPLIVYLLTYARPALLYGAGASEKPYADVVHIAAACWAFHYGKRLFETLFIHRFSHGTMPIMNLFKNCSYYWGFGLYIAYYINHPLYTPPACRWQIYGALGLFAVSVSTTTGFR